MNFSTKNNVQRYRNTLEQEKGKLAQIKKTIKGIKQNLKLDKKSLKAEEQALEIVREVGLKTQQQLQYHIGDVTSMALEAVFPKPYKLIVEFVQRRDKTECDLYFERDEEKVDPLEASGGGAVDVATFALRIASWSMEVPKFDNTIILDEPFRFLSADMQEKASEMIKTVSTKLGIQFIIVTHESTLTPFADRIFETKLRKGVTIINSK